jgi:hypothetical protein
MVLFVVSSLVCFCNPVKAEPVFTISVDTPIENTTYAQNNLIVNVNVGYTWGLYLDSLKLTYYLDGQPISSKNINGMEKDSYIFNSIDSITLTELSNGKHTFQVKGSVTGYYIAIGYADQSLDTGVINFSVGVGVAPKVAIFRLAEYKTSQALVTFTLDRSDATISYSLDGQANVTLPQTEATQIGNQYLYNVTFSGLSDDMHILNAYATDSFGNTGSTIANFRINTATPTSTEKPSFQPIQITNIAIIAGGVIDSAVIVSIALLIIYRKQNLKRKDKAKSP